ncbi:hypothetical protein PBY51_002382 [Eleginops maclovinus]|uniref:Uncharacterized protein n=1 Tax=Eleginops maclovinus TaxID=56733 RepID=A0AAN7XCI5_ELEMC|nr:hypothetical protein PBY51_002382 [Eleginops maclovinus]
MAQIKQTGQRTEGPNRLSAGKQLLAGALGLPQLTHCRRAPVNGKANHWTALSFSTDGRIPLPKFSSDAPMTS